MHAIPRYSTRRVLSTLALCLAASFLAAARGQDAPASEPVVPPSVVESVTDPAADSPPLETTPTEPSSPFQPSAPSSDDPFGALSATPGEDPFDVPLANPAYDPFAGPPGSSAPNPIDPQAASPLLDPAASEAATPPQEAPRFMATAMLAKTDWSDAGESKDIKAFAGVSAFGAVARSEAVKFVFPRGRASVFSEEGGAAAMAELRSHELLTSDLRMSEPRFMEEAKQAGVEQVGVAELTLAEPTPDGGRQSVTWTLLVTEKLLARNEDGGSAYQIAVLGWKLLGDPNSANPARGAVDSGERFLGTFRLDSGEGAIVAPAFPGTQGVLIAVQPRSERPRSLGPLLPPTRAADLVTEDAVDWEKLVQLSIRHEREQQAAAIAAAVESTTALEPPPMAEPSKSPDPEAQAVVFRLEHASAEETASLVRQIVPNSNVRVVSDARTNSIVVHADPSTPYTEVRAVIAILERLDAPAAEAGKGDLADSVARRTVPAEQLRGPLAQIERECQQLARDARATKEGSAERRAAAEKLRHAVEQAFRARLDLQWAEAEELRGRLKAIESNLDRRERVRGAVIDRRVEVLLDPALEWPDVGPSNMIDANAAPPIAVQDATPDLSRSPIGAGNPLARLASSNEQPTEAPMDEFSAATSLATRISKARSFLRSTPASRRTIEPQVQLLRQEFDAREAALRSELQGAEAKLLAAQRSYERVQALYKSNAAPQEEVDQAEANLAIASAEIQRLKVMLTQFAEARATIEADGDDEIPANEDSADGAPAELAGTWRCIGAVTDAAPNGSSAKGDLWRFEGNSLTIVRKSREDVLYRVGFDVSASPPAFESFREIDVPGGDDELHERSFFSVYSLEGDSLKIARELHSRPTAVAPARGVQYFEFERVADAAADDPAADGAATAAESEIADALLQAFQGAWQRTKRQLGADSVPAGDLQWRVRGTKLFERRTGQEDVVDREYDLEIDAFASPRTLILRPVQVEDGPAETRKWSFVTEYYELRLARAARRDDVPAASVEPGEGIEYVEFTRLVDDDPAPATAVEPAADESLIVQWARDFKTQLDDAERDVATHERYLGTQETSDSVHAGVSDRLSTARGMANEHRASILNLRFYVERARAETQERIAQAKSDAERATPEKVAQELSKAILAIDELVDVDRLRAALPEELRQGSGEWVPPLPSAGQVEFTVDELRTEFRTVEEKLKSLSPEDPAYGETRERASWLYRNAVDAVSKLAAQLDVDSKFASLEQGRRSYQDAYFRAEKGRRDAEEKGKFDEAAVNAYWMTLNKHLVDRNRRLLAETTARRDEFQALVEEMEKSPELLPEKRGGVEGVAPPSATSEPPIEKTPATDAGQGGG